MIHRGGEIPDVAGETKPEGVGQALAKPQAKDGPQVNAQAIAETETSRKEAPRPATPAADADNRLAAQIPQIEANGMPLGETIELLSATSGVPIAVDPDALRQAGASLRDPVHVRLGETTLGKALAAILAGRKLACVAAGGAALVTSPPEYRRKLRKVRVSVSDLTGGMPIAATELAELIEKFVVPESWRSNGGHGAILPEGSALAMVQTAAVQDCVAAFLDKLRTARGKPAAAALASRRELAKPALLRPATANFSTPTPLAEILRYLQKNADVDIFLDLPALRAAGLVDDVKATLSVQEKPLAAALSQLLEPLGLACRTVDARTLQVTTRKALDARLELELYPVAGLLSKGQSASALVERIKSRAAAATWSDAGGVGLIHFDPRSECLIVLQSQPVQAAVQALLAEKEPSP